MLEPERRLQDLKVPVPVNIKEVGEFLVFSKGDKEICKFTKSDQMTMFDVTRFLNGILGAQLVLGEIEQLRDLLLGEIGS